MEYCKSVKKKKKRKKEKKITWITVLGFIFEDILRCIYLLFSSEQFDPNASFVTQKLENLRSTLKFEILKTNLSFSWNTID